jgi:hypothetical protein
MIVITPIKMAGEIPVVGFLWAYWHQGGYGKSDRHYQENGHLPIHRSLGYGDCGQILQGPSSLPFLNVFGRTAREGGFHMLSWSPPIQSLGKAGILKIVIGNYQAGQHQEVKEELDAGTKY